MPRLLLLLPSTTYRGEAFLEAAGRLNVPVTVGCDAASSSRHGSSVAFLPLDFRQPDAAARAAVEFSTRHPIDAVVGVDDTTAVTAAAIAAALGLPHNPVASVTAARNKYYMRESLSQHGVPIPRYTLVPPDADPTSLEVEFPCVVKPLILSASCGVIRANGPAEFVAAVRRVRMLLHRLGLTTTDEWARHLLVEEFIAGPELAVEGLLTDSGLTVLALFDKPDPLEGPFFEETIYVTPSRQPARVQADIAACVQRATTALGLREGPIHAEVRVNKDGVWMIEVAARSIGGRCSQMLRFASNLSLEELILRQALRLELPSLEREPRAAGVMMLPIPAAGVLRAVRGQEEAQAVPGIEAVTITAEPGLELVPLPEGTRYLGFLLARGENPDAVEASLREAHRLLKVDIEAAPANGPARSRHAQVIRF